MSILEQPPYQSLAFITLMFIPCNFKQLHKVQIVQSYHPQTWLLQTCKSLIQANPCSIAQGSNSRALRLSKIKRAGFAQMQNRPLTQLHPCSTISPFSKKLHKTFQCKLIPKRTETGYLANGNRRDQAFVTKFFTAVYVGKVHLYRRDGYG